MKWLMTKIIFVLMLIHIFSLGMMLVDYGASFKCYDNIYFEGLIFENVKPRIAYHSGLLLMILSFIILELLVIYELTIKIKNKK